MASKKPNSLYDSSENESTDDSEDGGQHQYYGIYSNYLSNNRSKDQSRVFFHVLFVSLNFLSKPVGFLCQNKDLQLKMTVRKIFIRFCKNIETFVKFIREMRESRVNLIGIFLSYKKETGRLPASVFLQIVSFPDLEQLFGNLLYSSISGLRQQLPGGAMANPREQYFRIRLVQTRFLSISQLNSESRLLKFGHSEKTSRQQSNL